MRTLQQKRLHILLVEKDLCICELFESLFTGFGCTVKSVSSGNDAIVAFTEHRPDAVYSALNLNDMHGFDLCSQLRNLPKTHGTIFVAVTGYYREGIKEQAHAAGFDHYLLKPATLTAMLEPLKGLMSTADNVAMQVVADASNK
jgi:CheY-like chemotaxis protein